jgi:hypothetical protein
MGKEYSAHGKNENTYRILVRKPEERVYLEDVSVGVRIILKWIIRNSVLRCKLPTKHSSPWSRRQLAPCCCQSVLDRLKDIYKELTARLCWLTEHWMEGLLAGQGTDIDVVQLRPDRVRQLSG